MILVGIGPSSFQEILPEARGSHYFKTELLYAQLLRTRGDGESGACWKL